MKKPVEAIERMRNDWRGELDHSGADTAAIITYLDSLPEWVGEWPAELTRERLEELAARLSPSVAYRQAVALRALAAIAPQRKKRVVNLWIIGNSDEPIGKPVDWRPNGPEITQCVKHNVELED